MAGGERLIPLNFRVPQEFHDDLTEMTEEMDAQSRAEIVRCALNILYNARKLFKKGGRLLQEEGGMLTELLPSYVKKNGKRALVATGKDLGDLPDGYKQLFEDLGIDSE